MFFISLDSATREMQTNLWWERSRQVLFEGFAFLPKAFILNPDHWRSIDDEGETNFWKRRPLHISIMYHIFFSFLFWGGRLWLCFTGLDLKRGGNVLWRKRHFEEVWSFCFHHSPLPVSKLPTNTPQPVKSNKQLYYDVSLILLERFLPNHDQIISSPTRTLSPLVHSMFVENAKPDTLLRCLGHCHNTWCK